MKITVVGSTGRTGIEVVQQALEQGLEVVAWARNPEKLELEHPNLHKKQIDILSSDLSEAFDSSNAVVVALGGNGLKDSSTRSEGTQRILEAMEAQNIQRIVVVSTIGVGDSIEQLSPQGQHVVRTVIKDAVEDHGRQEALVQNSTLQWTIARPGGLGANPKGSYKADPTGTIRIGSVDRANVADFCLKALADPGTIGQIVGLSNE